MGKKFFITESEKNSIRKLYQINEQQYEEVEVDEKGEEQKLFCNAQNTKTLDDLYGDDNIHDELKDFVMIKKNGVKGLTDKLEALKTLRILPSIQDGGERLANGIMTTLQEFRPFNYFEESTQKCGKAMDKVIELYKENEHGEELVKDIEKVMASHHVSQRAKEFLKHGLNIVKGDLDSE